MERNSQTKADSRETTVDKGETIQYDMDERNRTSIQVVVVVVAAAVVATVVDIVVLQSQSLLMGLA